MANYEFTVKNHFQPFTFQEMLMPWTTYKEEYNKAQDAYTELSKNANRFEYLSRMLPENSEARKLYENYANELKTQAEILSSKGLSMANNDALFSLKRRYSGEIGALEEADTRLKKLQETRAALEASGKPMLYANENPTIDDFLYNKNPNLYAVNGDDLYAKGANFGKAISSREYSVDEGGNVLGGYYAMLRQKQGFSPRDIQALMQTKEFNDEVDKAMVAAGVAGNLTGRNYEIARENFIRGAFDGMVYQEQYNIQRDLGKLTPQEEFNQKLALRQEERAEEAYQYEKERQALRDSLIYERDENGNLRYRKDAIPEGYVIDPITGNLKIDRSKMSGDKSKSGSGSGSKGKGGGDSHYTQSDEKIKISWKGNNPNDVNGDADDDYEVSIVPDDVEEYEGEPKYYNELPTYMKQKIDRIISKQDMGDPSLYKYYYKPFKRGALWGLWDDKESSVTIVPLKVVVGNSPTSMDSMYDSLGDTEDEE